jgi:hypothetical protein
MEKKPSKNLPQKPSEKKPVSSSIFKEELKKSQYYEKLGLSQSEREKIGKILGDKSIFGEIIEKEESWKVRELERELRYPGSTSSSEIKKKAEEIRKKYGPEKARVLADIIKNIKI